MDEISNLLSNAAKNDKPVDFSQQEDLEKAANLLASWEKDKEIILCCFHSLIKRTFERQITRRKVNTFGKSKQIPCRIIVKTLRLVPR